MQARAIGSALLLAAAWACAPSAPGGEPAAPDLGAWPVAVEQPEDARPAYDRVVLVTIDTLRADHVSCYGYRRKTTPFLDSLAERGVLFTRALAAVSHTAPSHATMLTGLVPAAHGVLTNGGKLAPAALDLAELFGGAGFETAAFLNVQFLSGIAGSFGHVAVSAIGQENGQKALLNGKHVVSEALAWLEQQRRSGRFFLWVHLYDPHKWKEMVLEHRPEYGPLWPGETPPDFLPYVARLHGLPEPEPGRFTFDWNAETKAGQPIDTESAEGFLDCVDAYDALTLFSDRQLERLFRGVEGLGLPGRTLWIVTSDHGEGLASHGVGGHGARIYQEQLLVPLVVHVSDGSLAARTSDELVGHVDLFATLAESLGARVAGREGVYDGRSLWPLLSGTPGARERVLFAQRRPPEGADGADPSGVYSLQDQRHKYILHEPGADEFFDLAADPCELADRAGGGTPEEERLRGQLEERLRVLQGLVPPAEETEVPEEWMQELRDLGYVR